eukprot:scaffold63883_cov61-Phaeocystis_antarctica.AAC.4
MQMRMVPCLPRPSPQRWARAARQPAQAQAQTLTLTLALALTRRQLAAPQWRWRISAGLPPLEAPQLGGEVSFVGGEPHQRLDPVSSLAPIPHAGTFASDEMEEDARFRAVGGGEAAVVFRDIVPEEASDAHEAPLFVDHDVGQRSHLQFDLLVIPLRLEAGRLGGMEADRLLREGHLAGAAVRCRHLDGDSTRGRRCGCGFRGGDSSGGCGCPQPAAAHTHPLAKPLGKAITHPALIHHRRFVPPAAGILRFHTAPGLHLGGIVVARVHQTGATGTLRSLSRGLRDSESRLARRRRLLSAGGCWCGGGGGGGGGGAVGCGDRGSACGCGALVAIRGEVDRLLRPPTLGATAPARGGAAPVRFAPAALPRVCGCGRRSGECGGGRWDGHWRACLLRRARPKHALDRVASFSDGEQPFAHASARRAMLIAIDHEPKEDLVAFLAGDLAQVEC